ncbi:hypothetical protein JOC78_000242 [Bacillus ectoiniformans]|uniref:hypothetical protein n=1 Tax=Bacillus ectoiniformans TaxID=1494429 RepID=UPI001959E735|nr:hypothetical protein [Bacillus ectoiniformans]MBM7647321.1 hypothetical protein [Bacillus ectoiniformans]
MKKWNRSMWLSLVIPFAMLSGCSSDEEKADPPAEAEEMKEVPSEENEKIRLLEKQLTYKLDGQTNTETAFLKNSDHQPYSLYVLQNFEFTAEEPQKDVIFSKQEDQYFMRIEVLSVKEPDSLIEEVNTALSTVNPNVQELPASEAGAWLSNARIFQSAADDSTVTAYLIPSGNKTIKLTVFDNSKQRYQSAFLTMAETLSLK